MRDSLRDLMSGRSKGFLHATARAGLQIASRGYQSAVNYRNRRFDRGIDVHRAAVPVVSVGNLTAGGTGKTPVVAYIANYFRGLGVQPALLSRGYKNLGDKNDEALVLEQLCPGVPHLQHPDRVASAKRAVEDHAAELLILDDGFQHRRLERDLDIVLVDATNPFGYGHLLPRGLLREPVTSLSRADIILLTRVDAVSTDRVDEISQTIQVFAPSTPLIEVAFPPQELVNSNAERRPLSHLLEVPTLAFCGIGNPQGFAATLSDTGITPTEIISFPDHYHYQPSDLDRLSRRAHARGVAAAVTTRKDLVKIQQNSLPQPSDVPLWAVEIGCHLLHGEDELLSKLHAMVSGLAQRRAA